jgi:hypothetical protein
MINFPFVPVSAGYTAELATGVRAIIVDGGRPRERLEFVGTTRPVTASYVLYQDKYDLMLGYFRKWERAGGGPVQFKLMLDSMRVEDYVGGFVAGSPPRISARTGRLITVSVSLWVETKPLYADAETDPVGIAIDWNDATYGDMGVGLEVLLGLQKVVRALPND